MKFLAKVNVVGTLSESQNYITFQELSLCGFNDLALFISILNFNDENFYEEIRRLMNFINGCQMSTPSVVAGFRSHSKDRPFH